MEKLTKIRFKVWAIIVTVILFTALIFILVINNYHSTTDNNFAQINQNNFTITPEQSQGMISTTLTPTPVPPKLQYNAWIPNWASSAGLSSVKENPWLFNSLSPTWYEVNEDGTLKTTFPGNRSEIITYTKTNKIKLIPTIAMFDHEILSKVLESPENFKRHIQSIVDISKLYDGIDLDYESTKLADKELYFEMLTQLNSEFSQTNKMLVVTVIAKWGDDIVYPSLPETRQVQDWKRIGELASEVRIMAYDYTFSKSYFPGPIAPLGWTRDILNYAKTKIKPEKIVLGIHLYSYEWSIAAADQYDFIIDMSANKTGDTTANSYTYSQIKSLLQAHSGQTSEFDNETIFRYELNGQKKTLVYQTPEQLKTRINLAKEFGIKGVVFWRLGDEADLLKNI